MRILPVAVQHPIHRSLGMHVDRVKDGGGRADERGQPPALRSEGADDADCAGVHQAKHDHQGGAVFTSTSMSYSR